MNIKMLLATTGALFAAVPAHAGRIDVSMSMTFAALTNCSIVGNALIDFGPVVAGPNGSDIDVDTSNAGSTPITLNCNGVSVAPVLNFGSGGNDVGGTRAMATAGGAKVNYLLYANSNMTATLPPGAGLVFANLPLGDTIVPVYARIPAGQIVPVGDMSDTVTLTLNF